MSILLNLILSQRLINQSNFLINSNLSFYQSIKVTSQLLAKTHAII